MDHLRVQAALEDEADRELLTRIVFRDEPEKGPGVEDCLWTCRRERLERRGREVVKEIGMLQKDAEQPDATSQLDERLAEIQRLARQRDALQN